MCWWSEWSRRISHSLPHSIGCYSAAQHRVYVFWLFLWLRFYTSVTWWCQPQMCLNQSLRWMSSVALQAWSSPVSLNRKRNHHPQEARECLGSIPWRKSTRSTGSTVQPLITCHRRRVSGPGMDTKEYVSHLPLHLILYPLQHQLHHHHPRKPP